MSVCVVPEGILFKNQKGHRGFRETIVTSGILHAVVSLPSGAFLGTNIKTALLFFGAPTPEYPIFMGVVEHVGYSLRSKKSPLPENDLPDMIRTLQTFRTDHTLAKTEIATLVSRQDITKNAYNLCASRYKEFVLEPSHGDPLKMIDDLIKMEHEILQGYLKLRDMLVSHE